MASCVQCGSVITSAARGRPRRYCSRSCQARAYRARTTAEGSELSGPVEPGHAPADSPAFGSLPGNSVGKPSTGLSVECIVAAAVRIADTDGLDVLTMRQVAADLGVATMSLYHYVHGKDELIELMLDAAFMGDTTASSAVTGSAPAGARPDGCMNWRTELEGWARYEWTLISRHPWVLRVVTTFPPVTAPALLTDVERVFAALVEAGLDPIPAYRSFQSITGLVEGLAALRTSTSEAERKGITGRWRTLEIPAILERLGPKEHPVQSALLASLDEAMDVDLMFEFGLARLLDGIGNMVEQGRSEGGR
ncbi:TetR/AcrR family transcriptional regulator [Nocardia sp. NPDC058499]|uniref:TetR/AcrR family transcriptional regulator n=1 Tax=Nocardia sp. NPDC058499 TaxID=3346530 RepID=UPI00365670AF